MLRMFSLFARTEFIWLTMFCSDAWFLELYSNLQSTQIYYITNIWKLDLLAIDFNYIFFILLCCTFLVVYNKFQLQVVSPVKEIVKYLVKVVQVASKAWSKFRSRKVVSRVKMKKKKRSFHWWWNRFHGMIHEKRAWFLKSTKTPKKQKCSAEILCQAICSRQLNWESWVVECGAVIALFVCGF